MGPQDKCTLEVEAPMPDKHLQINNAIESLDSVINRLQMLLAHIENGDNPPDEPKTIKMSPTLLEILNEAPGRLNNFEGQVYDLLNRIETNLFN